MYEILSIPIPLQSYTVYAFIYIDISIKYTPYLFLD